MSSLAREGGARHRAGEREKESRGLDLILPLFLASAQGLPCPSLSPLSGMDSCRRQLCLAWASCHILEPVPVATTGLRRLSREGCVAVVLPRSSYPHGKPTSFFSGFGPPLLPSSAIVPGLSYRRYLRERALSSFPLGFLCRARKLAKEQRVRPRGDS